jgi:hypothetical protein
MVTDMGDMVARLRRDILRWNGELALAEAGGFRFVADTIRSWISEANQIIADSGY